MVYKRTRRIRVRVISSNINHVQWTELRRTAARRPHVLLLLDSRCLVVEDGAEHLVVVGRVRVDLAAALAEAHVGVEAEGGHHPVPADLLERDVEVHQAAGAVFGGAAGAGASSFSFRGFGRGHAGHDEGFVVGFRVVRVVSREWSCK